MPNYIKLGNLRIEIPEPANNGGGGGGGGSSSLLTGLLAFYNLSDLTDASGNGNTLTNNGGVTFSSGKIGNAATFGGSNYLESIPLNMDSNSTASISLWFKNTVQQNSWRTFIGRVDGGLNLGLTSSNQLFINDWGSMSVVQFDNYSFNTNWDHVAIIVNGSDLKLYYNGLLNKTVSNGLDNVSAVRIGAGTTAEGLIGQVDAVGFWSRAITDAEVAELYNAGAGKEHPFA
jgi:hypothetical protein